MVEIATNAATTSLSTERPKTDYWYIIFHEVANDGSVIDYGKTHLAASESLPHFAMLKDLLGYAMRRRQLPCHRVEIEAVTSLTLFGQRVVSADEKVRTNAVYHVYFNRRPAAAEIFSDDDASNTECED